MSIASEIERILTARNVIRNKLISFSLAEDTDKIDVLATKLDSMPNNGAVAATVQEGDTYTIPQGYHNGSGIVSGVAGGGNYTLQTKGPITPTKNQISVTPDNGYYGLSAVTIDPIPQAYQDVTAVTATASQVLATKIFVASDGTITTGIMPNNGAISQTLSATSTSYTVPSGYHNGSGIVKIVTETKSATPSTASQDITPTSGKVLSKVTVNAIPSDFKNITSVTAAPTQVLAGTSFVNSTGLVAGTMPNIGAVSAALDTATTSYTIPSGYHNGSGSVSIALESKTVSPTYAVQTITPSENKVLSEVTVQGIPHSYINVMEATASAADLLSGKIAFSMQSGMATGIVGTMSNHSAVVVALSTTSTSYTVPSGYHNGNGMVRITLESKTAAPKEYDQTIVATSGKVLSHVYVQRIPTNYGKITGDTVNAEVLLQGYTAHATNSSGVAVQITGTMANRGAISSVLSTASPSYKIPQGYHNGAGMISIALESKSATPSTSSQTIVPSTGSVLSAVTINAIPSAYQDITGVTAVASHVLTGDVFVDAIGSSVTGTMANKGTITQSLSAATTSYTIPQGYHSGSGKVSITLETKSATPSTASQDITPTSGKVLSKVTVEAIPSNFKDTAGVTAATSQVLAGTSFVNSTGLVAGTMPNNGAIAGTIDGLPTMSYTIPSGYHNGSGTVTLTDDIEIALRSI